MPTDDALQRKIAVNESLLREANEAIRRGVWPGEEGNQIRFRCECAVLECNQPVELTLREYERVRDHPRRFVVLNGHQLDGAETVVERRSGYVVVEKVGEGGPVAEDADPRS